MTREELTAAMNLIQGIRQIGDKLATGISQAAGMLDMAEALVGRLQKLIEREGERLE